MAFFAVVVLAACTSTEGGKASAAASGGTFIYGSPGDALDLFPAFIADQNGATVADLVFDHLADISNNLITSGDKTFTPRLAKNWTWAPDSLSITFSLDPRARFHDGKAVTASDVRYSLRVFTDPKAASPVAPLLSNIDSASVKDSLTVVVWFKKHTPEQFYDVAYQLYILPEHVYGSIPLDSLRTSKATRTLVGSGQFRFVQWKPDVRIELAADTANYHGRPRLDRVIITPVGDPSVLVTQLLTGQIDFMQNFPPDRLQQLDSSATAHPVVAPSNYYAFLGMNPYAPKSNMQPHPIFSDVRVRRAISMALDRAAMLQNVFNGKGLLAHGPFPMVLAASDSTLKLPPYDTVAAHTLLDSAGWRRDRGGMRSKFGKPLRFSLMVPGTSVPRHKYAVLIQSQLRGIGAQVDIEQVDNKNYQDRVQPGDKAGDFDAILHGFGGDPSPSAMKQSWSKAGIGKEGQNALHYSNPKVDALIDSLTTSFDPAKVKQYASRAYQQIIDDVPAVWLYDYSSVDGVNRRIDVGLIRPDGWWHTLAEWSIPPDKRIDRDRIPLSSTRR
jgi:peptide/nickel transport system substrate-binding protein